MKSRCYWLITLLLFSGTALAQRALPKPGAVIPEFRLNPVNRWLDQDSPCFATDGQGSALMVWRDWRNGIVAIYGQHFANGAPSGDNFLISPKGPNGPTLTACLAPNGHFAVAWARSGQLILQFGNRVTQAMETAIDLGPCYTGSDTKPIDFTFINDNSILITWVRVDDATGGSTLHTCKYDMDGEAQSFVTTLTDAPSQAQQHLPRLLPNADGSFIAGWMERESYQHPSKLYTRQLNANLEPLTDATLIHETEDGQSIDQLEIFFHNGSPLALWFNNSAETITTRRLNAAGAPTAAAALLAQSQFGPGITPLSGNRLAVSSDLMLQIYDAALTALGSPIALDQNYRTLTEYSENHLLGAATYRRTENRDDNDMAVMTVNLESSQVSPLGAIADASHGADIEESWIVPNSTGGFTVFWEIWHNHFYADQYNAMGQRTVSDIRLYDFAEAFGITSHHRHYLQVGGNSHGDVMAIWDDNGLQFQRLLADGSVPGPYQAIAGNPRGFYHTVNLNDSGSALITWEAPYPVEQAGLQIVDAQGNQRYTDPVTDQAGWPLMETVSHAIYHNNGQFALAGWKRDENNKLNIVFQTATDDGSGVNAMEVVNAADVTIKWSQPAIAWLPAEEIYWIFYAAIADGQETSHLYARAYNSSGEARGDNLQLVPVPKAFSFAADAQGRAVVAWEEGNNWWGEGENIYARRFQLGESVSAQGDQFILHSNRSGHHWYPKVAVQDGKIYATWIDNHVPERGMSAYAAVLKWDDLSAVNAHESTPGAFSLHPAYPNPFNPVTTITYSLPAAGQVKVEIFDIRGRLVETLLDGPEAAGPRQVQWEAGSHPSGVYLCRTVFGKTTKIQKLILQK